MQPKIYSWQFDVRTYELDIFGYVSKGVYQNYLEEVATQASADVGYDWDSYMAQGRIWVLRKITLRYHTPAKYGDTLRLNTWVSGMTAVRSYREYEMRRVGDEALVLRAQAEWVLVDMETLQPQRIDSVFHDAFAAPRRKPPLLEIQPKGAQLLPDSEHHITFREVQSYEVDIADIVNNGNYLRWLEHAFWRHCRSAGWPIQRQLEHHNFLLVPYAQQIEYLQPARLQDGLRLNTYIQALGRTRGVWVHQIYHHETHAEIANGYTIAVLCDTEQKHPQRIPDFLFNALGGTTPP